MDPIFYREAKIQTLNPPSCKNQLDDKRCCDGYDGADSPHRQYLAILRTV